MLVRHCPAAVPYPVAQRADEGKDGALLAAKAMNRKTQLGVPPLDSTGSAAKMLGN